MPSMTRAGGQLQVTAPDSLRITDVAGPPVAGGRRAAGRGGPRVVSIQDVSGQPDVSDALVEALRAQDLVPIDSMELAPEPAAAVRRGRGRRVEGQVTMQLAVEPGEDGVVLLEQEGMYSWVWPRETAAPAAAVVRRRGGARAAPGGRTLTFQIDLQVEGRPAEGAVRGRRGLITDFVFGKAKAFVFKYALRITGPLIAGQAIKLLERNVRKGLVQLRAPDIANWTPTSWEKLNLPKDRPARVLLFVHGTFSSTVGGYHGLGMTPWGRAFLSAAIESYDAVIGFDHPTLSVTPLENATDLLTLLEAADWPAPPHIDLVCHSRGGLVVRSLIEHLLPGARVPVHIARVVFVAATNGGTALAEPDNWARLIDAYTNLAAVAFKVAGMLPHAQPATVVLNEALQGLGAFVKFVASAAVDDKLVPGLAAMEPDGDFIKMLNQVQPGQPGVDATYYCVMSSDFRVRPEVAVPKELPERLLWWIKDNLADALMRQTNDLIVNVASMSAIDVSAGKFVKDRLAYDPNPLVYHSNYFLQPEAVDAFTRWLLVPRGDLPTSALVADVPAAVSIDVLPMAAGTHVAEAIEQVESTSPSYVLIRRSRGNEVLHYALRAEDFLGSVESVPEGRRDEVDVAAALDLHERGRDEALPMDEVRARLDRSRMRRRQGAQSRRPTVVLRDLEAVGVLPPARDAFPGRGPVSGGRGPLSIDELVVLAQAVEERGRQSGSAGAIIEERRQPEAPARLDIAGRRALPSFAPPADARPGEPPVRGHRAEPPPPPTRGLRGRTANGGRPTAGAARPTASAPPVVCHCAAQMPSKVVVNRIATVDVTVSQEMIQLAEGRATATASVAVDPSRKLIIQVQPIRNFTVDDDGSGEDPSRAEIDPPAPGQPVTRAFDLRPTDVGDGEVHVMIRQHQTPIVTLVLHSKIEARSSGSVPMVSYTAAGEPAEPMERDVHQLFIYEREAGGKPFYTFTLDAPGLGILRSADSPPLQTDKVQYVAGLYQTIEDRWLSTQQDSEDFQAELQAMGAELYRELFPPDLRQAIWDNRERLKSIMVVSTEPFIPWELVHLVDPNDNLPPVPTFLGQMGLVRWLHNLPSYCPTRIAVRDGRVRTVIPQYPLDEDRLPEAEQEFAFLRDNFRATAVVPQVRDVRQVLAAGDFDLLHFACHGATAVQQVVDGQIALQGRLETTMEDGKKVTRYIDAPLDAQLVRTFASFKSDNRPMVVLNACQSGRAGHRLTGIGGFASAFLQKGAGAFIGSLWSVGDRPARTFTERLYSELLANAPLSDAAIAAREAARAAGDATWLAYAVYGHPLMRLARG